MSDRLVRANPTSEKRNATIDDFITSAPAIAAAVLKAQGDTHKTHWPFAAFRLETRTTGVDYHEGREEHEVHGK